MIFQQTPRRGPTCSALHEWLFLDSRLLVQALHIGVHDGLFVFPLGLRTAADRRVERPRAAAPDAEGSVELALFVGARDLAPICGTMVFPFVSAIPL